MSAKSAFIAVIDQGSTATKGAIYSASGTCRFETSLPIARRVEGVSVEHDPIELARQVADLLDELLQREKKIGSIGLTCQRSTCLIWDRETGGPLSSSLSWQDRSERARVDSLGSQAEEVARRTGLHLSPHYAASKLARLLEEIPSGHRRAENAELVIGTLDAFLVRQLTGVDATEPGHAGRTLLFNLESGEWDPFLCDLFGIPAAALPDLRTSAGIWGEHRGLPLTAVAGDQQAALLGHGGWSHRVAAAHFGTGAFVLASTGSMPLRHPGLLSAVLATTPAERRFQLEGSVNSAGSAVDWVCRLTGQDLRDWQEQSLEPEQSPFVLPALAGVGAPWWKPEAQGLVSQVGLDTGPDELLAGVLAGVAMRVLDCVEALRDAGVDIGVLRLSGRLTRLRGFVQLLADAGQQVVEVAVTEETGLSGIARLALSGLTDHEEPLLAVPASSYRCEPHWDSDRAAALRQRWRKFVEWALEL